MPCLSVLDEAETEARKQQQQKRSPLFSPLVSVSCLVSGDLAISLKVVSNYTKQNNHTCIESPTCYCYVQCVLGTQTHAF